MNGDTSGRRRRPVQTNDQLNAAYLGEQPHLTLAEFAEQAGTTTKIAAGFWRSMGFPNVSPDERVFVVDDVMALRQWVRMTEGDALSLETIYSLVRAQSYAAERLAVWQLEAGVEEFQEHYGFSDTDARIILINHVPGIVDQMTWQLAYAWRRQMLDLTSRTVAEIANRPAARTAGEVVPLWRALGFIDMVGFTSRVRQISSRELVQLVQGFEFTARDIVNANGGRIVKTVGDAVLYVADDLLTGARIALAMTQAIADDERLLPVRASLVWGRVISRSGDIFGPAVNLASRLTDIAPAESVYTDEFTAAFLAKSPHAADFVQLSRPPVAVQGIGEINPIELRWANEEPPEDIWTPQ